MIVLLHLVKLEVLVYSMFLSHLDKYVYRSRGTYENGNREIKDGVGQITK